MVDKRKHFEEGFCVDCAKTFNNKIERLRAELAEVKAERDALQARIDGGVKTILCPMTDSLDGSEYAEIQSFTTQDAKKLGVDSYEFSVLVLKDERE